MLGVPVGHNAFVQKWLKDKEESNLQCLTRTPAVQDAQCAWLLLLLCAGPRANHIFRNLFPSDVSQFAQNYDNYLRACLADILAVPVPDGVVAEVVQLPFLERRLGLRGATRLAPAVYWASWADCLSQVHARAPRVSTHLLQELEGPAIQSLMCAGSSGRSHVALWRSGPESRPPNSARHHQSIARWESGLTVGNITHLLLATPSLQKHLHVLPLSTDHQSVAGISTGSLRLAPFHPICQRAKRPPSRVKSSARCPIAPAPLCGRARLQMR